MPKLLLQNKENSFFTFIDRCESLPDTANLETETEFPVHYDVVVTVICETGYYLSGADTITCIKGRIYKSHHDPGCIASKSLVEDIVIHHST